MTSGANIDFLVTNERRAIYWYAGWFVSIILVGIALITLNLAMGWMKEVGPAIGSAFVLLLAKPPLTEVLKRRDRISALNTLKFTMSQSSSEGDDSKQVEKIVWDVLQKMAEG